MLRIPSLLLLIGTAASAADVCTYEGGWSLRINAKTCPINAPVNCGPGIQLRCCPNGLTCAGEGDYGGSWCCKEGEDCRSQASSSPKCPDQTWTLWGGSTGTLKDGGWCCQPGDNGFYRGNMEAVGCTAAGVRSLPTGYHFAKTVQTNACVAPTSSATSSPTDSSSPTPTSMEDSDSDNASTSLSGGAIAGIVVGAICGMALIAGIFALAWYRKKRARNNEAAAAGGAYSSPDMAQQQAQTPSGADSTYYGGGGGAYHDTAAKHHAPPSPYGSPQHDGASELGGVQRHEMGNGSATGAYHEME
ncbi:WSC2 protein [Apiospora marii]|uniref:WSC2 protein n=1 Tax=Apiospora marii TaxID=335849 RepID=UPI00312FA352